VCRCIKQEEVDEWPSPAMTEWAALGAPIGTTVATSVTLRSALGFNVRHVLLMPCHIAIRCGPSTNDGR
jgi:hypothetical protein